MFDMIISKNEWDRFFLLRRKSWFWCAVQHLLDPEFYKYTIPQIVLVTCLFGVVLPIVAVNWLIQGASLVLPIIVGIITAIMAGHAWGVEGALVAFIVSAWLTAIPYGWPEFWADVKRKHRAALSS